LLSAICQDVNFINARLELHVQVELEPTGHKKTAADSRDGASRTDLSNNGLSARRPRSPALEYFPQRTAQLCVPCPLRELLADINQFNELERGLPHVSRTLLTERLRRLEQTGILVRRVAPRGKPTEYRLTQAGYELQKLIDLLGEWGARWAFGDPRPNELDPIVLLWWMRRRVCVESLGKRRVVIEFNFGAPKGTYWLLIEPADISVCLKHPGFDVDVIVSAEILAFYRVWLGRVTLSEALRKGQVQLNGTPADIRGFPHWFTWSPMADTVRVALADQRTAERDLLSAS